MLKITCYTKSVLSGQNLTFKKLFNRLLDRNSKVEVSYCSAVELPLIVFFQNDFSNFETPSLAVFKVCKTIFFVYKVQKDFYSFPSCFHYENKKIFVFTKILFSKSNRLHNM